MLRRRAKSLILVAICAAGACKKDNNAAVKATGVTPSGPVSTESAAVFNTEKCGGVVRKLTDFYSRQVTDVKWEPIDIGCFLLVTQLWGERIVALQADDEYDCNSRDGGNSPECKALKKVANYIKDAESRTIPAAALARVAKAMGESLVGAAGGDAAESLPGVWTDATGTRWKIGAGTPTNADDAIKACADIGPGWRVSLLDEVKVLVSKLQDNGLITDVNQSYWTRGRTMVAFRPRDVSDYQPGGTSPFQVLCAWKPS